MRRLLTQVADDHGIQLQSLDYLDDGSPIQLKVTLDKAQGSAVFDFEGTGPEMIGNLK